MYIKFLTQQHEMLAYIRDDLQDSPKVYIPRVGEIVDLGIKEYEVVKVGYTLRATNFGDSMYGHEMNGVSVIVTPAVLRNALGEKL